MKWQVASNQTLPMCCWDDETVVYNPLSGDTHLLDAATADILKLLQHAPLDQSGIMQALPAPWHDVSTTQIAPTVARLLAELDALALIEQTPT